MATRIPAPLSVIVHGFIGDRLPRMAASRILLAMTRPNPDNRSSARPGRDRLLKGRWHMTATTSTRAHELYLRARQSIPGGVTSAFRAGVRPEPIFVDHAQGVRMIDVDGVSYLDFALAWGPLILGHGHPAVLAAVRAQLERGHMYGAQHELEVRV